jgi:hypothetical protein
VSEAPGEALFFVSSLFTGVRGRTILGSPLAGSCIAWAPPRSCGGAEGPSPAGDETTCCGAAGRCRETNTPAHPRISYVRMSWQGARYEHKKRAATRAYRWSMYENECERAYTRYYRREGRDVPRFSITGPRVDGVDRKERRKTRGFLLGRGLR